MIIKKGATIVNILYMFNPELYTLYFLSNKGINNRHATKRISSKERSDFPSAYAGFIRPETLSPMQRYGAQTENEKRKPKKEHAAVFTGVGIES